MKFTIDIQIEGQEIPKSQRELIQKALRFYLDTAKKFNQVPTDSEAYELFDMETLMAVLEYPLLVDISEEQKESFCQMHGRDFPIYVK